MSGNGSMKTCGNSTFSIHLVGNNLFATSIEGSTKPSRPGKPSILRRCIAIITGSICCLRQSKRS